MLIYRPLAVHVGRDMPVSEPFRFHLGFAPHPDGPPWPTRQAIEHATGFGEIASVRLAGPGLGNLSQVGRAVSRWAMVATGDSSEHLAGATLRGRGRIEDFRPEPPLLFRWWCGVRPVSSPDGATAVETP